MGIISNALQAIAPARTVAQSVPQSPTAGGSSLAPAGGSYTTFARAYSNNEIVYAAVELLATSAAEPHIIGRRWRRNRPTVQQARRAMLARGVPHRMVEPLLVENGFMEDLFEHPLVRLLNHPNPVTSRFHLWSTVIMDRYLAGNAYVLKARTDFGNVAELWRLRPDRVRILTDVSGQLTGYEYRVGNNSVTIPADDVVHWRTRNPLDDHYGMPPLMAVAGRIDIDNYMRGFLKTFFERGGTGPGAILTVSGKLPDEAKDSIRDKFKRMYGGPKGWHEVLILDNTESTYSQMGLDRGLRDALPKEIDNTNEARIAMAFGIPGSILGLLIGYESSSYANKKQDWQVLWDVTLAPLYSDLDDVLNLALVPEFGGIDEVLFDLTQVKALQEDEDKLQDRARKNFQAGGWTLQEFRAMTGVPAEPEDGTLFVPGNMVPRPAEAVEEEQGEEQPGIGQQVALAVSEVRTGRPRTEDDPEARRLYDEGQRLKLEHPGITNKQIAARLGLAESTYRKYRARFRDS